MNNKMFKLPILIVFLLSCGSEPNGSIPSSGDVLDNGLTFVKTFGDDFSGAEEDEFLLVRPLFLRSAPNGDIILMDENRLKVYNGEGIPKMIVGGPGQGPGEFAGNMFIPSIGNSGLLTVIELYGTRGRIHFFSQEYTFIETKYLNRNPNIIKLKQQKGWDTLFFNWVIAYSTNDIVFNIAPLVYAEHNLQSGIAKSRFENLYHLKNEEIVTIVESVDQRFGKMGAMIPEIGKLIYTEAPGKKIVYSETNKEKVLENEQWFYFINFYDIDNQETTTLKKAYSPVAIPDDVINPDFGPDYNGDQIMNGILDSNGNETVVTKRDQDQERQDILRGLGFYPAIQQLFEDQNILFARTYEYDEKKGDKIDLFDIDTKEFIGSTYMLKRVIIKNGFAYKINNYNATNDFPKIEVYKIDPAVYGK